MKLRYAVPALVLTLALASQPVLAQAHRGGGSGGGHGGGSHGGGGFAWWPWRIGGRPPALGWIGVRRRHATGPVRATLLAVAWRSSVTRELARATAMATTRGTATTAVATATTTAAATATATIGPTTATAIDRTIPTTPRTTPPIGPESRCRSAGATARPGRTTRAVTTAAPAIRWAPTLPTVTQAVPTAKHRLRRRAIRERSYEGRSGRVRLEVRPDDASVYVDDEFRGTAREARIMNLPPGRHRIELVRPGFAVERRELLVVTGESQDVLVELLRP